MKAVMMVRQATSVAAGYIGLLGQIIYDTGLKTLRIHDTVTPGGSVLLASANNLADLADIADARATLGLGSAALSNTSDFDPAGAADAVGVTSNTLYLRKANNLSDLPDPALACLELGLGSAAHQDITAFDAAGLAAGVQASSCQRASNLSDVANVATARTNLGLGSAATHPSTDFDSSGAAAAVLASSLQKASNLSDVANAKTSKTNLGIKRAVSPAQAINAPLTAWTHGLGAKPDIVKYYLTCTSADHGYSAGEVVEISCVSQNVAGAGGLGARITSTQVIPIQVTNGLAVVDLGTGATVLVTNTKWTFNMEAFLLDLT